MKFLKYVNLKYISWAFDNGCLKTYKWQWYLLVAKSYPHRFAQKTYKVLRTIPRMESKQTFNK